MDILVVGGGGREHAIIKKLKESASVSKIYCAPGNGGISLDAECVPVKADDIDGMVRLCKEKPIGFAVVTPDDPLALGMVDALSAAGVKAFGPDKKAALIESSKVFSKNLMKKYGIPTAGFEAFDSPDAALAYIKQSGRYPAVVKADGLALGKGVVIAADFAQAEAAIDSIMREKKFGASGSRVVVEEFLEGPEVSVLCFTDSKTIKPMVSSMDHKRAFDGDNGPNTGGMGTVSPNPFYTDEIAETCMKTIFLPTIRAMEKEGRPFKGCLYFGLMLTKDGPKVIEYNARFGDPETQVVIPRLKSDLFAVFNAVCDETLADTEIEWDSGAAACVVLASGGYPLDYVKGLAITGVDEAEAAGAVIYHAGTKRENGVFKTAGGRVLGVTAVGPSLGEALKKAYAAAEKIHFDKIQFRRDIGRRALEANNKPS